MFENYILILFFAAMLVIWIPWLLAQKIRPYFGKKALNRWLEARKHKHLVVDALQTIEHLYQHSDPFTLSKRYRDKHNINSDQFLYGEIHLITLIKLMDMIKPRSGELFYDLGSGSGKAVLMASICYPLKCKGLEFLPTLYELSDSKLKALQLLEQNKKRPKEIHAEFLQQDFLEYDFSDGNIFFINATAFKGEIFDKLESKLSLLKKGTRIIITSLEIKLDSFELIYHNHEVMSWGFCNVRIYQKI